MPGRARVPGLPPFGPAICYEVIYSGEVVDGADRPAWIVTVTNDAWFGNSTGPRQHLAAAGHASQHRLNSQIHRLGQALGHLVVQICTVNEVLLDSEI